MESDNYILHRVHNIDPLKLKDYTLNLVTLDIKLASKCYQILSRKMPRMIFTLRVDVYDPLMYLLGHITVDDFIVDSGAVHYSDVNYFVDGDVHPEGGVHPPLCPNV